MCHGSSIAMKVRSSYIYIYDDIYMMRYIYDEIYMMMYIYTKYKEKAKEPILCLPGSRG